MTAADLAAEMAAHDEHADAAARFALIEFHGPLGDHAPTSLTLITAEMAGDAFNDTCWEVSESPDRDNGPSRKFAAALARNLNRALAFVLPSSARAALATTTPPTEPTP